MLRAAGLIPSSLSREQGRTVRALLACRTAALGGHVDACQHCGHIAVSYNSCRNRHCPKCQASQTAAWLESERAHLLPVPYTHVVFTLPQPLAPLALQNSRVLYALLFRAVAETLLEIARDPRHLGAEIGFLAILHTWGQTLTHHPHLHCLVPAGGLSADGTRWIACRPGFFLPVRVLSSRFRTRFLAGLLQLFEEGRLHVHGGLADLARPPVFGRLLQDLRRQDWVVYAKPPFGGPETLLQYLARYTHRVAISNARLLSLENSDVRFAWTDYRHAHRTRTMTLSVHEFARRFLLHVLPARFVRIRRYGLLANARGPERLKRCRQLLGAPAAPGRSDPAIDVPDAPQASAGTATSCPICGVGFLLRRVIPPPDSS